MDLPQIVMVKQVLLTYQESYSGKNCPQYYSDFTQYIYSERQFIFQYIYCSIAVAHICSREKNLLSKKIRISAERN